MTHCISCLHFTQRGKKRIRDRGKKLKIKQKGKLCQRIKLDCSHCLVDVESLMFFALPSFEKAGDVKITKKSYFKGEKEEYDIFTYQLLCRHKKNNSIISIWHTISVTLKIMWHDIIYNFHDI